MSACASIEIYERGRTTVDLVTLAEVELYRPQSALGGSFAARSDQRNGIFVVADEEVDTLKEAVLNFAAQCGVDRAHLQGLQRVSGHQFSVDKGVITFDIYTRNVQYSTPYAACRASPALKVGARYFKLSEVSNVNVY
jgi:hypothetical protein